MQLPRLCGCGDVHQADEVCPRRRRRRNTGPTATELGYDHHWTRTRNAYAAAHPDCECGGYDRCDHPAGSCTVQPREVDHVDGLGPLGPHGHDWANLQHLCSTCHRRATQHRRRRGGGGSGSSSGE
ncbi:hypothetical protein [Euzebya rosea]|uniref:hypothetical protein n=1 Tax=Euzebya rosea TaxID=2052804 RepID=UPI000D3E40FF|nr:hypothetical protein [Euzebya rosea]